MLWPAEKLLPMTGTEQQKKKKKPHHKLNTNRHIYIRGMNKYFLLKVQTLWSLTSSF